MSGWAVDVALTGDVTGSPYVVRAVKSHVQMHHADLIVTARVQSQTQ